MRLTTPRTAPEIAAFIGWTNTRAEWGYHEPREGWRRLEVLTPADLRHVTFRVIDPTRFADTLILSGASQQPMRAVPRWAELVVRLSPR